MNDSIALANQLADDFALRADEANRNGTLPGEDVQALKDSGYLALSVPEAYGGKGLPLVDCAAGQIELAQGSASSALVAAMPIQVLGSQRDAMTWDRAWYERLARLTASGEALLNSLASEPVLGSPSRGRIFATTAHLSDDGACYVVNGRKNWATGGRHLTHLMVRVSVADEAGVVMIPNHMEGVEWLNTWDDALSLRASASHDVVFRDVQGQTGDR